MYVYKIPKNKREILYVPRELSKSFSKVLNRFDPLLALHHIIMILQTQFP